MSIGRRAVSTSSADTKVLAFTLLEFLVAFAVLTLFLSTALAGIAVAMKSDQQAGFLMRATMIAQDRLASAGVDYPLRQGTTGGALANGYVWRAEIRRYGSPLQRSPTLQGYWVEVTVADPHSNGSREVSLATLVLAPAPAR